MGQSLLALIVEDSIDDTYFIVRELQRAGFEVSFERVETAASMRAAMEAKPWDIVLCDYALPQFDGGAALSLFQGQHLDIPFIIVSGAIGEERVADIIKAGANDCVLKDKLGRLGPAVARELQAAEQRRIQRQTDFRSRFLASLVESCDDAIVGKTLDGTIVSWNAGAERLYGYPASEMIGRPVSILFPSGRPEVWPDLLGKLKNGETILPYETLRQRKDGSTVEVAVTISPIRDHAGRVIGASSIARDISRFKREENERLLLIRDLTNALNQMRGLEPKTESGTKGPEDVSPPPK
jgi:PAS domain S-box-containing protein